MFPDPWSNVAERSGILEYGRAGFDLGPNLVLLELLCVRTVWHLWVTGYGCKLEFVKNLLVVGPFQRC